MFPQDRMLRSNSPVSGKRAMHHGKVRRQLVSVLSGRTELERGDAASIARKVGCSREYVRQVRRQLGVTMKPLPKPPSCTGCGKPMRPTKTRLCQSCRQKKAFVRLRCAYCGTFFQRRRSHHEAFLRRAVVQKRRGPICSGQCSAKVSRICSWCGRPTGSKWRRKVPGHAFCGPPAWCGHKAQSAIHPNWWRHITEDLLPMNKHLDEIARLRQGRTASREPHQQRMMPPP
jgi:hypothetical protein